MPYKPETANPKHKFPEPKSDPPAITVHAKKENKAPCGFVWPDPDEVEK